MRYGYWQQRTSVSEAALGAMTSATTGAGRREGRARKVYDAFASRGNFIDTANVYTNGTSESSRRVYAGPRQSVRAGHEIHQFHAGTPNAARQPTQEYGAVSGSKLKRLRQPDTSILLGPYWTG